MNTNIESTPAPTSMTETGSLHNTSSATNLALVTENGADQNSVEEPLFEDLFGKAENDDLCSKVEEQEDGFISFSKCTGRNVAGLALAVIFGLQTVWMCSRMNKMEMQYQGALQKSIAASDAVQAKPTNLLREKRAVGEMKDKAKDINGAEMKLIKEKLEQGEINLEQEAVKREYTELKRKVGAINADKKYKLCFCKAFVSQTAGCCWHFKNLTKFTFFEWDSEQVCCVTGKKDGGLWGDIMPGDDKWSGDILFGCATGFQIIAVVVTFCIFLITLECCCKSGFEQHCMGLVMLPETDLTTMEEIENWKTSHASFLANGANL